MSDVGDFFVAAEAIGDELREQLAVLLSRAYTDARHVEDYSDDERRQWSPDLEAVRSSANAWPGLGDRVMMPREWLGRFPTMRNLWREPARRVASCHFIARSERDLAGHVAMFEHEFRSGEDGPVRTGFIEDVATDPLGRGNGTATRLLTTAREHATAAGFAMMGLSTGIPEFYERLGWIRWEGNAAYRTRGGELIPNVGTMVLPLSEQTRAFVVRHLRDDLYGGLREGR